MVYLAYALTTIILLPCFYMGVYFFNKGLIIHKEKHKKKIMFAGMTKEETADYIEKGCIKLDDAQREYEEAKKRNQVM